MAKGKTTSAGKNGKKAAKPYRRPRGGEARAISDLMPEVGRAAFRRFGFIQSSVVSRWSEIVGERYAQMSAPEMIRFPFGKKSDGTLELTVEGAFAPMMQHVIPEIIERVNRFFGYAAIAKVKIRQGHVAQPEKSKQLASAPMLKPVPLELGDSLREIADPELQAVLESLATSLGNADSLAKDDE
ncbi:MAG: DciA family protein [Sphingorhabdus sp.]